MTIVREAVHDDIEAIVSMGIRFLRETPYGQHLAESPDTLRDLAENVVLGTGATVFVADQAGLVVGMIALTAFVHPMSGDKTASELVWWVDPEARGSVGWRLLQAAEQWAKGQHAVVMQMVAPATDERVGDFYQAVGYAPVEMAYQKRL